MTKYRLEIKQYFPPDRGNPEAVWETLDPVDILASSDKEARSAMRKYMADEYGVGCKDIKCTLWRKV